MHPIPPWYPWWLCLMAPDLPASTVRQMDARHGLLDVVTHVRDLAPAWQLSEACVRAIEQPDARALEAQQRFEEAPGCHLLCMTDPDYPLALRQIASPPHLLWVRGDVRALQTPQIAMVGARKATPMARDVCMGLAQDLAQAGWCVTSGLALGIDGAAHRGALKGGGQTVAVLGSGCDRIYPSQHLALSEDVMQHGAIVSEWPLGTGPQKSHFPQRNRIISGLSVGTVVVEAGLRSGSLITARLANEQGREVFAVPGAVQNPMAAGCHQLLQNGAKLVANVDDILEEFVWMESVKKKTKSQQSALSSTPKLAQGLRLLLECIDFVPTTVAQVCERSGRELPEILAELTALELSGHVLRVQQGYVRKVSGEH